MTRLTLLLVALILAYAVLRRREPARQRAWVLPTRTAPKVRYLETDDGIQVDDYVWRAAMADPAFVMALEEGIADIAAGRVTPLRDVLP